MDFSKLSDEDFSAMRAGNLSAMSDAGFGELMKQQQAAKSLPEKAAQAEAIAREKYNPTIGMDAVDTTVAGAQKFAHDTALGIGQRFGKYTPAEVDERRRLDAPLMEKRGAQVGNFGAAVGTSALASLLPGGQSVTGAGLYGALQGLVQPTGEGESAGMNAALGGGAGLLGTGGGNVLSSLLAPKVSPASGALYSKKVPMTIGQQLGGGANRFEEGLTSIPFMGDIIKNARREAVIGFNSSVADEALAPIGKKLPAGLKGHGAVMFTERAIGDAYDDVLANVGNVTRDSQFAQEVASLKRMVQQSTMPKEVQAQFLKAVRNQIDGKFQGQGVMTAQTFKDAESELGKLATKYGADTSTDKQLLGDALQEVQASLRGLLERSAGPQYAADARAANASWAQFKRMQKSATFLGAEDGVFSPENYLNSVKALDRSKDKAEFARGTALGQGAAQDALEVLGRKVPDSGTPFRSLVQNPLKGGAAALAGGLFAPLYRGGATQNLLRQLVGAQRPQSVQWTAKQLEELAPLLGALGIAETTRAGQ